MGKNDALFSSASDDWQTPPALFEALDQEFNFTLDACASPKNAKCARFYSIETDGFRQSWRGETVFLNPPYSRHGGAGGHGQKEWIEKAYHENRAHGCAVVMLIPARTDTAVFHDFILPYAEIRFLRGRVHFLTSEGVPAPSAAPFPSMVCIYHRRFFGGNTAVSE